MAAANSSLESIERRVKYMELDKEESEKEAPQDNEDQEIRKDQAPMVH